MEVNDFTQHIAVAAPVDTDTAGTGATTAFSSAVRIVCPSTSSSGTGFIHVSGKVVTAEHVIRGAAPATITVMSATGARTTVSDVQSDPDEDIALLSLSQDLGLPHIPLSSKSRLSIGTQVSTWGYPDGYYGIAPLLTVGYLAGSDKYRTSNGKTITRWVINAAFNRGNSGGPLLHVEDGSVIGVVASKVAPFPEPIQSALKALSEAQAGFSYNYTARDGTQQRFSEGQVVAMVLEYLRTQTQLVIGRAVVLDTICDFLSSHGVDPIPKA